MQFRLAPLPTVLLFHIFTIVQAANFTFTFGSPTQCDDFNVSWTGGTGPFDLLFIPEFGSQRIISIPDASFSNGKGSFKTQLPFPKGQKMLVSMADSTGWGSGGTSEELIVGPSVSNANCNTTDPGVDFFFELNTALQQCRPYTFSNYTGAIQPVTIWGAIPGGESFILNPPKGPVSFDWIADVSAGTGIVFTMVDSQGRKGGSSDIKVVGVSADSTCLDAQSPVSVSAHPSATSSASSTASSSSSTSSGTAAPADGGTEKKSNTGAIVGGILAGLFAVACVAVLFLFLWRRRRNQQTYEGTTGYGLTYSGSRSRRLHSMDLDPPVTMADGHPVPVVQPFPYSTAGSVASAPGSGAATFNSPSAQNLLSQQQDEAGYQPTQYSAMYNPHSAPPTEVGAAAAAGSMSRHERNPSAESGGQSSSADGASSSVSSAMRRKAALAGMPSYKPTPRYIVHQDLEETQEEAGEVIELPPQYSERRAPIPALTLPPGLEYAVPPPGGPPPPRPRPLPNPLEADQGDSNARLQQPIEPGPPTPTSPSMYSPETPGNYSTASGR